VLAALMVEAASTSETSVNFYQLHGTTSQKTVIFILAAVRTRNLSHEEFSTTDFEDSGIGMLLICGIYEDNE
jgi:hypothetical protein